MKTFFKIPPSTPLSFLGQINSYDNQRHSWLRGRLRSLRRCGERKEDACAPAAAYHLEEKSAEPSARPL